MLTIIYACLIWTNRVHHTIVHRCIFIHWKTEQKKKLKRISWSMYGRMESSEVSLAVVLFCEYIIFPLCIQLFLKFCCEIKFVTVFQKHRCHTWSLPLSSPYLIKYKATNTIAQEANTTTNTHSNIWDNCVPLSFSDPIFFPNFTCRKRWMNCSLWTRSEDLYRDNFGLVYILRTDHLFPIQWSRERYPLICIHREHWLILEERLVIIGNHLRTADMQLSAFSIRKINIK